MFRFTPAVVLIALLGALLAAPAQAVQRAYVSMNGNDANTATSCQTSAPCRWFATALTVVDPNGEVVAMDSGAYGGVVLTQSVSLSAAPGAYAGISVFSSAGVTINTAGINVVLRGLTINGMGGSTGVSITNAASVSIENCVIANFSSSGGAGILVNGTVPVRIVDSVLRNNYDGLVLQGGATADIVRTTFLGNSDVGLYALGNTAGTTTTLVVADTLVTGSTYGLRAEAGQASATVRAEVTESTLSNSAYGAAALASAGNVLLTITDTLVTGNGTGLYQSGAGAILNTLRNNTVTGNTQDTSGTITPFSPIPHNPLIVSLASPSANQSFTAPASIVLTANASDPSSNVTRVDFYQGNTFLGSAASPPYTYTWSNVSVGSYTLIARASDAQGTQAVSAPVSVAVLPKNNPPTISFKNTTETTGLVGAPLLLVATATDPDQPSLSVQFIDSATGQAIATGSQSGNDYSASWQPAYAGTYTLIAQATDNQSAVAQARQTITVLSSAVPNADSVAPSSYITPGIGTTAGTFSVSDSGASAYSIPIQVPPGTGGMQPSLALAYSSQGGYGPLGVGWSLSGLSSITRCPATYAQDSKKTGINYDTNSTNDYYCLDGMRLIEVGRRNAVSSDPLSAFEIEFRTELETYSRIVGYSEDPNNTQVIVGPNRFRVWTKSGQIMDYGSKYWVLSWGWYQHTINQDRVNTTKHWVLDRVSDRSGNYLTVDYGGNVKSLDNRLGGFATVSPAQPIGAFPNVEYWPTSIKYYPAGVQEGTTGSYNEVVLGYNDLPAGDVQRYYDSGAGSATLSKQLASIATYANGQLARSYAIEYEKGNSARWRLKRVRECGADDACMANPIEFSWTDSALQFGAPIPFGGVSNPAEKPQVGDLNGDGRSDIVVKETIWNSETSSLRWTGCLSTDNGFDCNQNFVFETAQFGTGVTWSLADVDGDGRADLIIQNFGNLEVCYSRSDGWHCTFTNFASYPINNLSFQGDLDGDGRIDFFYNKAGRTWTTCLSQGTDFAGNNFQCSDHDLIPVCDPGDSADLCYLPTGNGSWTQFFAADFNGDGKVDLIQRKTDDENNEYWRICFSDFDQGGTNGFICHKGWVRGVSGQLQNLAVLDFNGDGLADMATRRPYANTWAGLPNADPYRWQVCLSMGDGAFEFFDPSVHTINGGYVDGAGNPVDPYSANRCRPWSGTGSDASLTFYGDFNGDGRTDLLYPENRGTGLRWWVCRSTGNAFACDDWSGSLLGTIQGLASQNSNVVTGDFDGDGRTDILMLGSNGWNLFKAGNGSPFGDLLKTVTTGLGATTQVTYAPITDPTVYKKSVDADATQHELDIQSPLYVVKKAQASNGIGGTFDTDYFYEGLRGRTDGRGLFGFAKKRSLDSSGVVTETEYNRITPASKYPTYWPIVGRPTMVRKYAPLGAGYDIATPPESSIQLRLVNQTTTSWTARLSNTYPCLSFPCLQKVQEAFATSVVQESWDLLNGAVLPKITTTTSIDYFGNALQVVVSADGYSKTTASTYTNDPPNWILGRLTRATVTATTPSLSSTRVSAFTYHGYNYDSCSAALGVLCSETIEPDSPTTTLWQQTRYTYDAFGNKAQTTVGFNDLDSAGNPILSYRSAWTDYDGLGRFPIRLINALGYPETRTYDARYGAPLTVTDPNGFTRTTNYDGFGRKYLETLSDPSSRRLAQTFTTVEAAELQGQERYRLRSVSSGGGETRSYFDSLQRELRVQTKGFAANAWVDAAVTAYDALGRKYQVAKPAGSGTTTTTYTYDVLGRVKSEQTGGAGLTRTTDITYTGLSTVTTVNGTGIAQRSAIKTLNSQGQTVSLIDAYGKNTGYSYDPFGNLLTVTGPTCIQEQMSYDTRGRKTGLTNPDSGAWHYDYNGTGELVRQTDAKGQITRQFYDILGRMVERREHAGAETALPFVTVWSYDTYADGSPCQMGLGKSCETRSTTLPRAAVGGALPLDPSSGNSPVRRLTRYDASGRAYQSLTEVAELLSVQPQTKRFLTTQSFDANGRVDRTAHPSGLVLQNRYTAWSGQLDQLSEWPSGTVHWLASSRNADGQIAQMQVGPHTTVKTYDGFGRPATLVTGSVQNAGYQFDALGNLTARTDSAAGLSQSFGYDPLDRLTTQDGASVATYDFDGNLASRADVVGGYSYYPGTHRVHLAGGWSLTYDANGNVITLGGTGSKTLTYLPFNLPSSIQAGTNTLAYLYDGAHARIKESVSTPQGNSQTWYLGAYEEHTRPDGVVEQRHYLATPEGVVGVLTRRSNGANGVAYWHKDHLGSVVAITDAAGALQQRFAFTAWGTRSPAGDAATEPRGYTGHEHLAEVGLIHMNGRLYFDALGRFLQADPIVQAPYAPQNYNRYSYVLNNPLSLTDPTGYSWWTKWRRPIFAVAAAVLTYGAASGWMASAAVAEGGSTALANVTFLETQGTLAATGLTTTGSALAGAASGFAAGGIMGGNMESAVYGAFTGGISGGVAGYFGDTYSLTRVGAEAVAGGVNARIRGGKFSDGFKSALTMSLLTYGNYEMRQSAIENSSNNPDNINGKSAGFFGDLIKLAGARREYDEFGNRLRCFAPLGGCQGVAYADTTDQGANFLGVPYAPGGVLDRVNESFAGPHDWFRNLTGSYVTNPQDWEHIGDSIHFTSPGAAFFDSYVSNFALLLPAAPFAAAALITTTPGVSNAFGLR